jgi:hypothetical protein
MLGQQGHESRRSLKTAASQAHAWMAWVAVAITCHRRLQEVGGGEIGDSREASQRQRSFVSDLWTDGLVVITAASMLL